MYEAILKLKPIILTVGPTLPIRALTDELNNSVLGLLNLKGTGCVGIVNDNCS